MFVITTQEAYLPLGFGAESHKGDFVIVLGIFGERDFTNILESKAAKEKYVTFVRDSMDPEMFLGDNYEESDEDITVIPTEYMYVALDHISNIIQKSEAHAKDGDERGEYVPQVIVSGEYQTASKLIGYLEKKFRQSNSEISPIHFLRYFGYKTLKDAKSGMQTALGTNYIMPEDPLAFNLSIKELATQ